MDVNVPIAMIQAVYYLSSLLAPPMIQTCRYYEIRAAGCLPTCGSEMFLLWVCLVV